MSRPVLNYEPREILRGEVSRALRSMGGATALLGGVLLLALWLHAGGSRAAKFAVWLGLVGFGCLTMICMMIFSKFTRVEIQGGKINFYSCGLSTRSIPLDAGTTFQLKKIGRMEILVITRDGRGYVPNGALDRAKLLDFLRDHGVAETKQGSQNNSD